MKKFYIILFALVPLFGMYLSLNLPPAQIPREQAEHLLSEARLLPQQGVLREDKDGFVYLKVSDDYIRELFPLLSLPGYEMPPYFRRENAPGAHISVIYVEERHQTGKIAEIGKVFSFKVRQLVFVPPKTERYLVVEVLSPELERLREKYGLSPFLKGHLFHITIGKKIERYRYSPPFQLQPS